ncbi:MAG: hypothetical protein HND47_24725 [Chloroflexi bacterium]|nr:hypothetical protein [Chloroflexota bacterium]
MMLSYSVNNLNEHIDLLLGTTGYLATSELEDRTEIMNQGLERIASGNRPAFKIGHHSWSLMGPRQFMDSVKNTPVENLAKWYSSHWQEKIIQCLEYADRRLNDTMLRSFWFSQYRQFINELLSHTPSTELFFNHGYSDGIKDLDYRDKIVRYEGVYYLGLLLLKSNPKHVYEFLWDRISNGDSRGDLINILKKDLSVVQNDERINIIDTAWDIIAHCHDLVYFSQAKDFTDHGQISAAILETEYKFYGPGLPQHVNAAVRLAIAAIHDHCDISKVNKGDDGTLTCNLGVPETWLRNPLGAFLSLSLALHRIAVRICWYPTNKGQLNKSQPVEIILVEEIRLYLGNDARLVFVVDEDQYNSILKSTIDWNHLGGGIDNVLNNAIGSLCLGLTEGQNQLSIEWVKKLKGEDNSKVGSSIRNVTEKAIINGVQNLRGMLIDLVKSARQEVWDWREEQFKQIKDQNPPSTHILKDVRDHAISLQNQYVVDAVDKTLDILSEIEDDITKEPEINESFSETIKERLSNARKELMKKRMS